MIFRKRRSSMLLKSLDEIVVPAGPVSSTDTLTRGFAKDIESTVDDEVDPLDDKVGYKDLALAPELTEDIIIQELYRRCGDIVPFVLWYAEF